MAEGLRAIDPGVFTTVQDMGRAGFREWGVPVGGWFDGRSATIANTLLENAPGCTVLELTLTGGVFQAECPLAIAMAGARTEASILSVDGRGRPFRTPGCGMIQAREKLIVGPLRGGARSYLAVRGGWQTPLCLGSRSSERRLGAGDLVPAKATDRTIPTRYLEDWGWVDPTVDPLRILDGPDRDCLEGNEPDWWDHREWRVGSKSNRMGLRLEGDLISLTSSASAERLSAPVSPGAIQIAGGRPIILGPACGTMGGYPHVAHVISADLGRLGQLRPGAGARFRRVSLDEARRLDVGSRETDRVLLARISAIAGDRLP